MVGSERRARGTGGRRLEPPGEGAPAERAAGGVGGGAEPGPRGGGASSVTQTVCVGRQSAGGIITSGREIRGR